MEDKDKGTTTEEQKEAEVFLVPSKKAIQACKEDEVVSSEHSGISVEFCLAKGGKIGYSVILADKPTSDEKIEVTRVSLSNRPTGYIVGWGDVTVGEGPEMTKIYDMRVVKSKKQPGTYFSAYPQSLDRKSGNWYTRIKFPKELDTKVKEIFQAAVLAKATAENSAVLQPPTAQSATQPAQVSQPAPAAVPAMTGPVLFTDDMSIAMNSANLTDQLFGSATHVYGIPVKSYSNGLVRGIDKDGYRFITQNPNRDSSYAKMAQQGHKIIWVLKIRPDLKTDWHGVIIDNKFERRSNTANQTK